MAIRNTTERWGAVAKLLHWMIVALILVQVALITYAEDLPLGMEKLATIARHKSVGMTILALAILRLTWRWLNPTPRLPPSMPVWQQRLARLSHGVLYGTIFLLPLSGWMMSSAKNFSVSWFNLFQFPDLVAPSEATFEIMHDTHESLVWVLAATALLHIAGALKHHFVDRDDVLKRMLPGASAR
ncbi:MAG TPA: cytochrome b [Steroidobacteraceae bacterium]|nr:cytochrome b [Steroidobacteraceae bacterium]HRX89802.1 cytochrome b [Steroidobacteraceae bacterium]